MTATWTRGQLWDKIVEQAQKNPKYYELLLSDPRALMQRQLGTDIPEHVNIQVLEETPDTYYVVLPYTVREGAELSDSDLEKVAGGKGGGLGSLGGAVGGISGEVQGVAGDIRSGADAIRAGAAGLAGGLGHMGGGGGAHAAAGAGGQCAATGNAVGTTIVDISL
jgi:hypothetical protein